MAQVGRVPLLLLDSYVEENEPDLREVTDRLYGGGSEHRLRQELLLGIGGVRAVRAFCALTGHPEPEVFHTNEGHAGFLGLERIREYVEQGLTFDEALEVVPGGHGVHHAHAGARRASTGSSATWSASTSPTTPAGAAHRPGARARRRDLPGRRPRRVQHGRHGHAPGPAGQRRLAAARPGQPGDVRRPVAGLRHRARCRSARSPTACTRPPGWRRRSRAWPAPRRASASGRDWGRAAAAPAGEIWAARQLLRARLVAETRRRLRASWRQRGASEAELTWIDDVLDENVLTIGFARRVPSYKRLTLMLNDPDRLSRAAERPGAADADRGRGQGPSGRRGRQGADPADGPVQPTPRDVRRRIVFLPDYDMAMAHALVQGCDVWLNNPLRPLEACGTSGMKAALNGGLNLSVRDGWWDEWYDGGNGWEIPSADGVADPARRDELEAYRALRAARQVGGAAVLRAGRRRRPAGLGGEDQAHAALARAQGAGRADGPGVRVDAVRAGRAWPPAGLADAEDGFGPARELAAWKQRVVPGLAAGADRARGDRGRRAGPGVGADRAGHGGARRR